MRRQSPFPTPDPGGPPPKPACTAVRSPHHVEPQLCPSGLSTSRLHPGDDLHLAVPQAPSSVTSMTIQPARRSRARRSGIVGGVDQPAVEESALDLDDHPEVSIEEVDTPDEAIVVAHLHLAGERRLAGLVDDRLEPELEVAVGRAIAIRPSQDQLAQTVPRAGRATTYRQILEVPCAGSRSRSNRRVEHPIPDLAEPLRMHPTSEVTKRPHRHRDRDAVERGDIPVSQSDAAVCGCTAPTAPVRVTGSQDLQRLEDVSGLTPHRRSGHRRDRAAGDRARRPWPVGEE